MSRAFLTTMPGWSPDPLIAVEVAWGADLTDLDGSGWAWSDISDHVLLEGPQASPISITVGRADESAATQTALLKVELDNRDGRYINTGMSPLWPNVRRGTPVRVRVSTDNGGSWSLRFQGQAVGFTPHWDTPGRWSTVTLEASGPLRVLDQGTLPALSTMVAGTLDDPTVTNYWPCEDKAQSTFVAPLIGDSNGSFMIFDPAISNQIPGAPGDCASYTDYPGSGPMVTLKSGGNITCDTGSSAFTASTTTAIVTGFTDITLGELDPVKGAARTGALLTVYTPNGGSVKCWEIVHTGGGSLQLDGYPAALHFFGTSKVFTSGAIAFGCKPNAIYRIGLRLSQSGGTTSWTFFAHEFGAAGAATFSGTRANTGTNAPGVVTAQAACYSDMPGMVVGHIIVRNGTAVTNPDTPWFNAYNGEAVATRLERVANRHGIQLDTIGVGAGGYPAYSEFRTADPTATCGPQFWDTLSATLRETEVTGQGLLYDGLGSGLTYVSRRFRHQRAAAATLTLDASSGHLMEPFEPIDDDQILFNHIAVTRHGGNQAVEYIDRTGPEGTDTVGDHSTSFTVNPTSDTGLVRYAEWGVNVGTVPGYRYPTVSFAIHTNPGLAAGWLACVPQSRIDITNPDSVRRQLAPDPIRLLLEGWTETISMFEWQVIANTSSAEPWLPIRLAAATGSTGDDICHLDTDSSQLNTSVAAGATSISVRTNSGPRWVATSEDSDSFPFDITIGGVKATVTGITGTTSPQTFALSAPLPRAFTGSTTPGAGAPIAVWRPPVLAM